MHIENEGKNENVWRRKWEGGGGVKGAAAGENEEVPVDPANLRWKVAVAGDLFLVWLEHCAPEAGPGQLLLECLRNRRFCPSNDENHCPSICLSVCLPNRYPVLSYYFSSHSLSLFPSVSFSDSGSWFEASSRKMYFCAFMKEAAAAAAATASSPFCSLSVAEVFVSRQEGGSRRTSRSFLFLFSLSLYLFLSFSLSYERWVLLFSPLDIFCTLLLRLVS